MDRIRNSLSDLGVPSPRGGYWSPGAIHALLQPSALLQYAGFAVWNVHGARGRHKPPAEWVVVGNGRPAIITPEEADAIQAVNRQLSRVGTDRSKGRMSRVRSGPSHFILSGGLMVCTRCGANTVGRRGKAR